MRKTLVSLFSANLISKALGGIYTVLLIRVLSVEDYALFTNFQAVYSFLGSFVFAAFNYALVTYYAQYADQRHKIHDLYVVVSSLQVATYLLLAIPIVYYAEPLSVLLFSSPAYVSSIRYGCTASFGLILSNLVLAIFQAEEDFRKFNLFNLLRPAALLAGILLAYFFYRIDFVVVSVVFLLMQLALSLVFLAGVIRRSIGAGFAFGPLLAFTGKIQYLLLYFIVLSLFEQFGVFFLSRFSSKAELANYGVAYRYYNLAGMLIVTTLNTILLPAFARKTQSPGSDSRAFLVGWLRKTVLLAVPLAGCLWVGRPLYVLANGAEYRESYEIFCIFAAGVYFSLLLGPVVNLLVAEGAYKFLFISICITFAANVALSLLLVKPFGGFGVTLSNVLCYNLLFHLLGLIKALSAKRPST
jgi:O-antigen/teichoic acid export membrane protein